MNISSIVIKSNEPESCAQRLNAIEGVEVALIEGETIIATIEAQDTSGEIKLLGEIEHTEGVLSAAMHYTYFEDDLRDEISKMTDSASEILNNEEAPKYGGNVEAWLKKARE